MSTNAINIEQASSSSLWDRMSIWASENKAVAYTIAGTVVVVTGAGVVYYLSESSKKTSVSTEKRKSKKERRKEKKQAEEAAAAEKAGIKLKDEEAGVYLAFLEVLLGVLMEQPLRHRRPSLLQWKPKMNFPRSLNLQWTVSRKRLVPSELMHIG